MVDGMECRGEMLRLTGWQASGGMWDDEKRVE